MKLLFSLLTLAASVLGVLYVWDHYPVLRHFVEAKFEEGEFHTLEVKYSAEQIMATHRKDFLKSGSYSFLEPKLSYYPYLLMEVKYSKDSLTTGEGVLLWSLTDGEMVIDAFSWDKTHGYEDCLLSNANENDLKILKAVFENGGPIDRERLYRKLKVDSDLLDDWVESSRAKKLIAMSGNRIRLHFQNPRFEITPVTRLHDLLVAIPAKYSARATKRYSPAQIKKLANLVFGSDFAVRKMKEVFLPVYTIAVQNPDGSVLTTYWNAINGQPFNPPFLTQDERKFIEKFKLFS